MSGAAILRRGPDILAGAAVAGLMLPEAVAYAGIAGLPPGRAILAGIAGGIAYAVLGRSRFAIVSPTSSAAAMLFAALATLAPAGIDRGVLATAIVAIVGLAFLAMGFLRLGGAAAFISRPVLHGFALGLATTIILKQLPALFGIPVQASGLLALVTALVRRIGSVNLPSLAIGGVALVVLLVVRARTRLPGALIVLVAGIALASIVDLKAHGVALVGMIQVMPDRPQLPAFGFATWSQLVQLTIPLVMILFAESWGTMRTLALQHGDSVSANRELCALGGANLLSALAQGMPVGAGFSVGSASEAAGASTRLTGLVAALGLAAMALLAGPAIARIPEPLLAAIVIAALTHALSPAPIVHLFRIGRDQWIAVAAAIGVLGLGVLDGMLFAVLLSLGALLRRFATPGVSELGRLDSHDFVDCAQHPDARPVAGIAIFRPNAPLFFGNAEASLMRIAAATAGLPRSAHVVLSLEETDDLDSTALDALAEFEKSLAARGIALRLARLHDHARALLQLVGMSELARNASFSVADAVDTITKESRDAV